MSKCFTTEITHALLNVYHNQAQRGYQRISSEESNLKALSRAIGLRPINSKKPRGLGKSGQKSDRVVKHKVDLKQSRTLVCVQNEHIED